VIKIRRGRRPLAVGFFAERVSGPAPAVSDLRDPRRDEPVVRVVGVIEVPYLKPIVRRRRRDRIDCRIGWPAKLDARLAKGPARPRKAAGARSPAPVLAPPLVATESSPEHGAQLVTSRVPALSAFVCGAAAACGFVLGRLATGGPAMFAAWLGVGLALLVTFVAAPVALGVGICGRSSARGVAMLAGALALTALVMTGADMLRPA
jgi:hypothetical protein